MKRLISLSCVLVVAASCEVRTHSSGPNGSNSWSSVGAPIGGACSDDGDCEGSATCASNYPGGYCFLRCTGTPNVCPRGSDCIRRSGSSSAECYQTCSSDRDCRSGYSCASVTGSSLGFCAPD